MYLFSTIIFLQNKVVALKYKSMNKENLNQYYEFYCTEKQGV